jgi:5-methylcytosine-specific restriction protein A
MPNKPKHACNKPGCSELVYGRFCEKHSKENYRRYNKYQRDTEAAKRYDFRWRSYRNAYIQQHPLCELCEQQGRLRPAEEVHHKLPLSDGGTHDWENLQALCKSCHSRITIKSNGKRAG